MQRMQRSKGSKGCCVRVRRAQRLRVARAQLVPVEEARPWLHHGVVVRQGRHARQCLDEEGVRRDGRRRRCLLVDGAREHRHLCLQEGAAGHRPLYQAWAAVVPSGEQRNPIRSRLCL